ncbi:discoidin domain-containing protein [Parabacteroides gordonii]|uniref:Peptide-N(4)-(N-acetyl-beta-glucosaminyl)asparagine amidase n=1 Tax=Parabacteroides gordonii MS-1 = DSM 23371 TaxID=1203610 RepID=A0A0F5JG68_9BACT|nr:discoidin domain-containing protein [Parabacteroides gordonii]KKB56703.1 hypothetical protein HMPREF1536_02339 [Parabacteroides gordonii MS-1 = DSM 23371]MCA5582303.1 discoidin domain-containing protein [Parabacteroides gordonii]RGP13051.1 hypothetical protein DXB27_19105 [Parabacteroides gordonii]
MKSLFIIGLNIFISIILVACNSSNSKRLEQALLFAGENRGELEKVLTHYENNPEKLEAARFLIRNMPRWYGYEGWQLDSIQPILAQGAKDGFFAEEVIQKWKKVSFHSLPKIYDAHVISADYLIENIDLSFDVWKRYPWNKHLGFDDFCELILPYRIGNEPLSSWRKLYHDHYSAMLDSAYQGNDVFEAFEIINADLNQANCIWNTDFSLPHQSADFLFYHRIGYCRDASDITLYAMRSCGIPVTADFFVYSPEYQQSHEWNCLRDTSGLFIPFGMNEQVADRERKNTDGRKKGKVYRFCYGMQEERFPGITANPKVPGLFRNRFIKDVTKDYFENEVHIHVQNKKEPYIYLGIFSLDGWIPIDIARNKKGDVTFLNIEPDIIYQPLVSDGTNHSPAGYPFIYTEKGIHYLEPDTVSRKNAILKRKMSLVRKIKEGLYLNIIGAKIEGANRLSFANAELLYQFNDTLPTNYNELESYNPDKKYRYIRYVSPLDKHIEIAEISMYSDTACTQAIPLNIADLPSPMRTQENCIDGNILTYFYSDDTNCSIVFDMGKATTVKKILFSPRNDDNYVWPGDEYELFYQDGINGWKSLGTQTASGRVLNYLVPDNALLWLRDWTKGREEQVFIHKDGKQYFTVDL